VRPANRHPMAVPIRLRAFMVFSFTTVNTVRCDPAGRGAFAVDPVSI
jgi:hypothetical protein